MILKANIIYISLKFQKQKMYYSYLSYTNIAPDLSQLFCYKFILFTNHYKSYFYIGTTIYLIL